MVKNVLRTALFLAIFCILFLGLTHLFIPKDNQPSTGIHEPAAKGFLAEPENSMDVLFIGDSEAFSSFIPLEIWRDHGITSYVCSNGNQVMYQSYAYLKRFFETQSPQIVILETNALFREYTLGDLVSYTAEEYFPYLRYHDRWKKLELTDLTDSVEYTYLDPDKGYALRTRVVPADDSNYMVPSDEVYVMPLLNQWYLRAIHNFCKEQNATLILVSTPSTTNWDYYYHNGVVQISEELGIPFIDTNLMSQEIPIDWQTDNYDGGDHLNYFGATKVTRYIGEYLHNTGLFSDKRSDPAFNQWNLALEDFNKRLSEQ